MFRSDFDNLFDAGNKKGFSYMISFMDKKDCRELTLFCCTRAEARYTLQDLLDEDWLILAIYDLSKEPDKEFKGKKRLVLD